MKHHQNIRRIISIFVAIFFVFSTFFIHPNVSADPVYPKKLKLLNTTPPHFNNEGIAEDTLVLTPDGYAPIADLYKDSIVTAAEQDATDTVQVSGFYTPNNYIEITLTSGTRLCTARNQMFYVVQKQAWAAAKDLAPSDQLQKKDGSCAIVQATVRKKQSSLMHTISLEKHLYFVTEENILVHNNANSSLSGLYDL